MNLLMTCLLEMICTFSSNQVISITDHFEIGFSSLLYSVVIGYVFYRTVQRFFYHENWKLLLEINRRFQNLCSIHGPRTLDFR